MNAKPRYEFEYSGRQVQAARRVLVDVGQVLAACKDAMVLVGGWVPDLLLQDANHIGSMDVDVALDAERLADGRYAELLKQLPGTGRYQKGPKDFQFVTTVDLEDHCRNSASPMPALKGLSRGLTATSVTGHPLRP